MLIGCWNSGFNSGCFQQTSEVAAPRKCWASKIWKKISRSPCTKSASGKLWWMRPKNCPNRSLGGSDPWIWGRAESCMFSLSHLFAYRGPTKRLRKIHHHHSKKRRESPKNTSGSGPKVCWKRPPKHFDGAEVAKDINEVFLLHGTKPPSAGASQCWWPWVHLLTTIWKQVYTVIKKNWSFLDSIPSCWMSLMVILVVNQYYIGILRGTWTSPCLFGLLPGEKDLERRFERTLLWRTLRSRLLLGRGRSGRSGLSGRSGWSSAACASPFAPLYIQSDKGSCTIVTRVSLANQRLTLPATDGTFTSANGWKQ